MSRAGSLQYLRCICTRDGHVPKTCMTIPEFLQLPFRRKCLFVLLFYHGACEHAFFECFFSSASPATHKRLCCTLMVNDGCWMYPPPPSVFASTSLSEHGVAVEPLFSGFFWNPGFPINPSLAPLALFLQRQFILLFCRVLPPVNLVVPL
jgi:hypothetical protein